MPHITKQEIKELREFLNVSDIDDTHWTHRMLNRIENQPEVAPADWQAGRNAALNEAIEMFEPTDSLITQDAVRLVLLQKVTK